MYKVVVTAQELSDMANGGELSAQEYLFAMNLLTGVENQGSDKTLKRKYDSLTKKGVLKKTGLTEKPDTDGAAEAWLSSPLSIADGTPEFKVFEIDEIVHMGRDGRFATLCGLMNADPDDKALRSAWVELENANAKGSEWLYEDGKRTERVPEVAYLYPQIVKAAQHQVAWEAEGLAEVVDRAEWIAREAFMASQYNARPGQSPTEIVTDQEHLERAHKAAEQLADMGEDYVPPHAGEHPLQSCRRLEARLHQARQMRAMA